MKKSHDRELEQAIKIVDFIQNGIEDEKGEVRDFDILDYYQNIKISPKTLYDNTINDLEYCCNKEKIKSFASFVIKNSTDKKITSKDIMNIKYMMIIDDEIREVTDEEKLMIADYLVSNKIRLTSAVFSKAVKRYLENNLDLTKDTKNKKSKKLVR